MLKKLAFFFAVACWVTAAIAQQLPDAVTDDDYAPVRFEEAKLGQMLFYDPILSGNKTVACATCHHPEFGTSDGVSLSIGDGGVGLGPSRRIDPQNPPEQRIPRNSPALFNLGAHEFTVMFHDGRLERDESFESGIRSPLDADMLRGFASVLSAQTMFPVLSRDEMAGSYDENEIGRAVRQGLITGEGGAWDLLARRVAGIEEYVQDFATVYPDISEPEDIEFTDISNAIAAFIALEWRSDKSRFDALLRGEATFEGEAKKGLDLFYGRAGCVECHSGPFQSDHAFHAMGVPQIGPGKAATFEDHQRDEGRFRVTGRRDDLFAFRTPSLRNVTRTAPYGHAGAERSLAQFLASHVDAGSAMDAYDPEQAILADPQDADFAVMNDPKQRAEIKSAVSFGKVDLSSEDISALIAFLETLTDASAVSGRLGVPESVPSGLAVPQGFTSR